MLKLYLVDLMREQCWERLDVKKTLLFLIEPFVLLVKYLSFRVWSEYSSVPPTFSVIGLVRQNANIDSAKFVEQNISHALVFDSKEILWDFALEKVKLSGHFLEFGVWNGYSINYFAKRYPNQIFYGFDSFQGLAEDWVGTYLRRGAFDRGGKLPVVSSNVVLVPGWFRETIPPFCQDKKGVDIAFIHLDADTYEATSSVLSLLGKRIAPGCIIVFDEHHGYPNWRNGEFRALNEFVSSHEIRFRYLGFSKMAAVIEII